MGGSEDSPVRFSFQADVVYWRGPSPYFFVTVPPHEAAELRRIARTVSYGWGMVPIEAQIGAVDFTTSLFPKDETYLLPLKAAVRRKTNITAGDSILVEMTVRVVRR